MVSGWCVLRLCLKDKCDFFTLFLCHCCYWVCICFSSHLFELFTRSKAENVFMHSSVIIFLLFTSINCRGWVPYLKDKPNFTVVYISQVTLLKEGIYITLDITRSNWMFDFEFWQKPYGIYMHIWILAVHCFFFFCYFVCSERIPNTGKCSQQVVHAYSTKGKWTDKHTTKKKKKKENWIWTVS